MILVEVKPRDDGRYDIYASEDGEPLVNSSQVYPSALLAHWRYRGAHRAGRGWQ